jgi:hypothetical protein
VLSASAVFAETCIPNRDEHLAQVLSETGKTVWKRVWTDKSLWPTFSFSEGQTRFALSHLNLNAPLAIDQSPADASISGQQIEVVDMRSWTTVFSMRMAAVNGAQRNVALSPAGDRVAILTKGAIEVYRLDARDNFDGL